MKTNKILCIGDSYTAGYPGYDPATGGNQESTYQYWLDRTIQKQSPQAQSFCVNKGSCGDTARSIVQRLYNSLKTETFDLVILSGGTNDLGLTSNDQILYHLKRGYAYCIEYQIPVVACAVPPLKFTEYVTSIKTINAEIASYAERNRQILFADWFAALQDEHGLLADIYDAGDGVHLSIAGYQRIGELLADAVKDLMCR